MSSKGMLDPPNTGILHHKDVSWVPKDDTLEENDHIIVKYDY